MTTINQTNRITRRDFLELSSAALAGTGLIANAIPAQAAPRPENSVDTTESQSSSGKIALEEHFVLPGTVETDRGPASITNYAAAASVNPETLARQIQDLGSGRIADLDRGGVELSIVSLTAPGIQAIPNSSDAISRSRRANDYLADSIAKSKRLKGFAALPLQDPQAAAQELTRCVKELGFCGALVNGFSQVSSPDSAVYYDLPQYRAFWATVQQLDVPFYLHPRSPLASRQQAYDGHPWLVGSVWGFAAETSIHALRLMGSGLFDEYPKLKIILGHLGEGLPFSIWRIDHRLSKLPQKTKAKFSMGHYLRENFYVTTSGNFRTQALTDVMLEIGADRVLYSVDYPFEDMIEATEWFDRAAISDSERLKIARSNAQQLFHL